MKDFWKFIGVLFGLALVYLLFVTAAPTTTSLASTGSNLLTNLFVLAQGRNPSQVLG